MQRNKSRPSIHISLKTYLHTNDNQPHLMFLLFSNTRLIAQVLLSLSLSCFPSGVRYIWRSKNAPQKEDFYTCIKSLIPWQRNSCMRNSVYTRNSIVSYTMLKQMDWVQRWLWYAKPTGPVSLFVKIWHHWGRILRNFVKATFLLFWGPDIMYFTTANFSLFGTLSETNINHLVEKFTFHELSSSRTEIFKY